MFNIYRFFIKYKEKIIIDSTKNIMRVMENVCKLKVPLVVDTEIGDNWGML